MKRSIHGKRIGKTALRALTLSAFLLAAPAMAVNISNKTKTYNDDTADGYSHGGAAISTNGSVISTDTEFIFENNKNDARDSESNLGGAISLWGNQASVLSFDAGEGNIWFLKNVVSGDGQMDLDHTAGGAIYVKTGEVSLKGGSVSFDQNTAVDAGGTPYRNAYGGAIGNTSFVASIQPLKVTLQASDTISFTNNKADSREQAAGGAIYATQVLAEGAKIDLSKNTAKSRGLNGQLSSGGAIFVLQDVTLSGDTITVTDNFANGPQAAGGAIAVGTDKSGTSVFNAPAGNIMIMNNRADATNGYAYGGAINGAVSIDAQNVLVQNNQVLSETEAYGGAFRGPSVKLNVKEQLRFESNFADPNSLMSYGGAISILGPFQNYELENLDDFDSERLTITAGTVQFNGNSANQGGAIHAYGGVRISADRAEFLTPNDTVYVGELEVFYNDLESSQTYPADLFFDIGALYAVPKMTFEAVGANSRIVVSGDLELEGVAHVDPYASNQLVSFIAHTIDLSKARLVLVNDTAETGPGAHETDFALVTLQNNGELLSPDVSAYRHGEVVRYDLATDVYKLAVKYGSRALVWNANSEKWYDGPAASKNWVRSSDMTADDWFWNNDPVWFTENRYGTVTLSGDVYTPLMTVTGGQYSFTGGALSVDKLYARGEGTCADFANTVDVTGLVSVDQATVNFAELAALVNDAPVDIGGTVSVRDAANGVYTVLDGGTLTLSGGTGTLTGLTVKSGATLNVNTPDAYTVTGALKIESESNTYFNFSNWSTGFGLGGNGESATAELGSGAILTITGIQPGTTGKWNLLSNFSSITADATAWSYDDNSLIISGWSSFENYTVTVYVDDTKTNYILEISTDQPVPPPPPPPPDGELIWTGNDGTVWSSASEKKPWVIASDDLETPYRDASGDTVPASFADGKTVTFNTYGEKQQNVTVADAVTANQVRVTAGAYEFSGEGKITANELMTANEGTTAKFTVPVSLKDKLDIGADTTAVLEQLRMELNTTADVHGKLDLTTVTGGGVFTVYKDGELTLSGGSGTLTGLTVNDGATLNVNSLGSYSVTDKFSALGGSQTYFNFTDWTAGNGFGLSGLGEKATAKLESGAVLTIKGITPGTTGKWNLLSNFSSITTGGWSKAGNTITIKDYDIDSYGYTWDTYTEGTNYVLVISKDEPVPPTPPTPPTPPEPADKGHTEVFHIASSVQSNVSAAAEGAALGEVGVDSKHLWASMWRENSRVYDSGLIQKNRAYGVVIGRDLARDENRTWGVAAHIGKADTSGKGAWDGATSDTDFWGLMVYGRHETEKWLLTGDAGVSWFRTDYTDANGAKADNARAAMLSVGGRAYYKWVDDPSPGKMNVLPFIGLRWNSYRQNAYGYNNGSDSGAWTADQVLVPIGVRFAWGESVTPSGWRVSPSFELSWTGALGDKKVKTGIFSSNTSHTAVDTPLFDSSTFGAQVRFNARRDNFHLDLNAGVRKSSNETDFNVGATLKWELGGSERRIAAKKRETGKRDAQLNRGKDIASVQKGEYSPEFKAKVVLEMISGGRSLEEVCARYKLNPDMVRGWKSRVMSSLNE